MSILIGLAHEAIFNAVWASVIVNQRFPKFLCWTFFGSTHTPFVIAHTFQPPLSAIILINTLVN
ncbi:hypothetical protein JI62_10855 [Halomonas campaniensis]|uniref:Uncharacterized protein n=1 Tax=Halomonas campaniensis TaxID=213554 RepID=A0A246S031_9GAMM|nr:hypothetical protein JI62_10855 [Halomonas campaniensis]